ncbi:MAG: hypothetical protein N3F66_04045 [Spirochaetes bacterium]|nr:hypothetical protein [Spirochaetota bacterium]
MKKIVLILCFMGFTVQLAAQIHGTAMGGISTVTSEGAIDTTRNPALLGTLSYTTASFYLMGDVYHTEDAKPKLSASGITINSVDQANDYYYSFSLFAGYAKPLGQGMLGYSISSKDNLYLRKKDTQKLNGSIPNPIPPPLSLTFEQTETTITDELKPTLSIAYGGSLSDNTFFGIQCAITPFFSNKKTQNDNSLSPTDYSYIITEYGVLLQPSLGFLLTQNDTQVGLRFTPSVIKCVKKQVEADFSVTDISYSDSWDIQQYEGPQIIAGGYAKIFPQTGIALEFGIIMPSSYTNTDINVTNNPSPTIKHSSITIHNDTIISMKGGIQLSFTQNMECMVGAAFFHFVNTAGSTNTYGKGTFNLTLITLGTNYSLSSTTILSTVIIITNGSYESTYHAEDTLSLYAKTKTTTWNCTVGAGLSYRL